VCGPLCNTIYEKYKKISETTDVAVKVWDLESKKLTHWVLLCKYEVNQDNNGKPIPRADRTDIREPWF